MKRRRQSARGGGPRNRLRLIGGRWRGRRLSFPESGGVRPSPDRVRETLFNWLGPELVGARVVDLFAGTGALGLEALSRGAASVLFVERDRHLAATLRGHLEALDAREGAVIERDVLAWLAGAPEQQFDLVMLDPPYDAGLHWPVLCALASGGWLSPEAQLYIEYRARAEAPALPEGWRWHRQSRAGEVGFGLAVPDHD